jgi:cytosine/adenosine deaminase-related metal-dependent hydrolase
MEQVLLKGDILYPEGWSEGSILMDGSRILDVSDSSGSDLSAERTVEGLIIPGLMDMHTHLGDHGARGKLPPSLQETVFPGGIKHQYLSRSTDQELISSIRSSISEVHPGVTFIIDFRERGIQGLDLLSEALKDGGPMVCPLARVIDGEDPKMVLEKSCGIGQPSLDGDFAELRDLVKRSGKLFSVHASELFREDISMIMDAKPDQVVHMISGTEDDWSNIRSENIPIVICPRSNLAYGMRPPLPEMLNAGLSISIGTDNSISARQDMFREMEMVWLLLRSGGFEGAEASRITFNIATGASVKDTGMWDLLPAWKKWWESGWPRKGDPGHLFVIRKPAGSLWKTDPFSQIVRFSGQSQVIYTPTFEQ